MTWATKKKDVGTFINLCGKCNRFKVTKRYNPIMGHSLNRVYRSYTPFSHVSLDPLGHLYCSTSSRTRMKIFPLIVQDINTGVICFEMMTGLSSKDIFLALQRIQFKYSTNITQIFTDAGTQMEGLGKETDYYNQKMAPYLFVYKNSVHCQFRNLCERKVKASKKGN